MQMKHGSDPNLVQTANLESLPSIVISPLKLHPYAFVEYHSMYMSEWTNLEILISRDHFTPVSCNALFDCQHQLSFAQNRLVDGDKSI